MPIPLSPNPQVTYLQQGNGKVLLSWNAVPGATNYRVERSVDGVTYSLLASPTVNKHLDTTVTPNTQYWYRVASEDTGVGGGVSAFVYPTPDSIVPVIAGYMSLQQLRLMSQQKADRINSNFVTLPEWNSYINLATDELYDLITTVYEDYQVHDPVYFTTTGTTSTYPLPDGITTFQDKQGNNIVPPPIYKLAGV